MIDPDIDERAERERLIFGAGFAFGVTFTMSILAVVVAAVVPRPVALPDLLTSAVVLPILAAIGLAAVAGVALYVFALPEHGFGLADVALSGDTDGE